MACVRYVGTVMRLFFMPFETVRQLLEYGGDLWQQADIKETVNELSRARLLNVRYGSNVAVTVSLSTDAIVLMEHKFKNKMDTVIDYAVKIKSLISF